MDSRSQLGTNNPLELLTRWSPWQPLNGCWLSDRLPNLPGLYRIRRIGFEGIDYIGQTGSGTMTLKKRLGMLRGVFADEMPYRDPHTGGPGLWALRHHCGCEFEVSVLPVEGDTPFRKGLESLAISLYRQEYKCSPTINFGRMPLGYRMSSGNNAKLASAGKRFKGSLCSEPDACHATGIAPFGPLEGDAYSPNWCGHHWSPWISMASFEQAPLGQNGLYRIRYINGCIVYLGEGKVRDRLSAHLAKGRRIGHSQEDFFKAPEHLQCSWVINNQWLDHQRLELENDLIAAHVLSLGDVPLAQFRG